MKMTYLARFCRNGMRLTRYHRTDGAYGRTWLMETTKGQFVGLLWEHDLIEDRTWLKKTADVA